MTRRVEKLLLFVYPIAMVSTPIAPLKASLPILQSLQNCRKLARSTDPDCTQTSSHSILPCADPLAAGLKASPMQKTEQISCLHESDMLPQAAQSAFATDSHSAQGRRALANTMASALAASTLQYFGGLLGDFCRFHGISQATFEACPALSHMALGQPLFKNCMDFHGKTASSAVQ